MKKSNYQNENNVPPFIAFGYNEKANINKNEDILSEINYYDYESQKAIYPYFCGSDKKITRSAKNVGSILFPKYKNHNDDAKEK